MSGAPSPSQYAEPAVTDPRFSDSPSPSLAAAPMQDHAAAFFSDDDDDGLNGSATNAAGALFSDDDEDPRQFAKAKLSEEESSILLDKVATTLLTLNEAHSTFVHAQQEVAEKDEAWATAKEELSAVKQAHSEATDNYSSLYSHYVELSGKKLTVTLDVYRRVKDAARQAGDTQETLSKQVGERLLDAAEKQTQRDESLLNATALEVLTAASLAALQQARDKYESEVGSLPDDMAKECGTSHVLPSS